MKLALTANPIGFGHISRCIALARQVRKQDSSIDTAIFTLQCQSEIATLAELFGIPVHMHNNRNQLMETVRSWSNDDALIIDDWLFSSSDSSGCLPENRGLIVQPNLDYRKKELRRARLLVSCSPPWFVDSHIRPFGAKTSTSGPLLNITQAEAKLSDRQCRELLGIDEHSTVISVLAGGGTYGLELNRLVNRTADKLEDYFPDLCVYHLIGPHASYIDVSDLIGSSSIVVQCPSLVFPYLRASSLVISQGGYQTLMELLVSRTPSVIYPWGTEQKENFKLFSSKRMCALPVLSETNLDEAIGAAYSARNAACPKLHNGASGAARFVIRYLLG